MNLLYIYAAIIILLIFKINPIQTYGQKFTTNNNKVYYIDNQQKYSWFDALIACIEMDMTLVTIDSSTKSNEINNLVRNNFGKVLLWIGGIMSRYPNRHFIWLDTGKPFSYTYWQGNNPDFYGNNEYCAHIGWGANLEWNDIACTNHQGFICEYSQKQQQTKQSQQEMEKAKKNQQDFEHQLQLNVQKQQELQQKLQEQQTQQDQLKQELFKVKESKEEDNRKHQLLQDNLNEQLEEQQKKLKAKINEIEKLEEDLKEFGVKQQKLQQNLLVQQNLKDLAQEELEKIKTRDQTPSSEMNRKYRDIILHIHQK